MKKFLFKNQMQLILIQIIIQIIFYKASKCRFVNNNEKNIVKITINSCNKNVNSTVEHSYYITKRVHYYLNDNKKHLNHEKILLNIRDKLINDLVEIEFNKSINNQNLNQYLVYRRGYNEARLIDTFENFKKFNDTNLSIDILSPNLGNKICEFLSVLKKVAKNECNGVYLEINGLNNDVPSSDIINYHRDNNKNTNLTIIYLKNTDPLKLIFQLNVNKTQKFRFRNNYSYYLMLNTKLDESNSNYWTTENNSKQCLLAKSVNSILDCYNVTYVNRNYLLEMLAQHESSNLSVQINQSLINHTVFYPNSKIYFNKNINDKEFVFNVFLFNYNLSDIHNRCLLFGTFK